MYFPFLRHGFALAALSAISVLALAPATQAQVLAEQTAGTESTNANAYVGQSLTTPDGGPFNNITFNLFSRVLLGFTPGPGFDPIFGNVPLARGSLFILEQEYLGAAQTLGSSTPGFLAQSQSTAGGVYTFDSALILQANTQYFLYSDARFLEMGDPRIADVPLSSGGNPYAGGIAYKTFGQFFGNNQVAGFQALAGSDLNFRLSGTPIAPAVAAVPEFGTVASLGGLLALGALGIVRSRRRKA